METRVSSMMFLTPHVQVLELRLPAVTANLHLKERIGFLRLSPFLPAVSERPKRGGQPALSSFAAQIRAGLLQFGRALRLSMFGARVSEMTIVHQEQRASGQPVHIPRNYLN